MLPIIKRQAQGFIPVNYFSETFLEEKLGVDDSQIQMLPLGVDTNLFYPSKVEEEKTREDLGIDDDEFMIITAGDLNETKILAKLSKQLVS